MKKIEIVTNEDGDVYGAVYPHKKLTKLGALRFINKELKNWGIEKDVKITLDDLVSCRFWETTGGECDGWIWWSRPNRTKNDFDEIEDLGIGWIYYCY